MNPSADSGNTRSRSGSNGLFKIAFALFLIAALLSAVDGAIFSLLIGAAVYLTFLAIYRLPRKARTTSNYSQPGARPRPQKSQPQSSARSSLATLLGETFRQYRAAPPERRRAIRIFISVFAAVFLLPVLISIFSSDNTGGDSQFHLERAQNEFQNMEFDSAYVDYNRALQIDPSLNEAWIGKGRVWAARDNCDSAIIYFDKAIGLDADDSDAAYYKAFCLYNQQQYERGLEVSSRLVADTEDNYSVMLLHGDFLYALDKLDDALAWYERAYQEGGMRGYDLLHVMGYLYEERRDNDRAVSLYREALQYDSTDVDIYERLGKLLPGSEGDAFRVKAATLAQSQ